MSDDEFIPVLPRCHHCDAGHPLYRTWIILKDGISGKPDAVSCSIECLNRYVAQVEQKHAMSIYHRSIVEARKENAVRIRREEELGLDPYEEEACPF